jgi:hypothetical protein
MLNMLNVLDSNEIQSVLLSEEQIKEIAKVLCEKYDTEHCKVCDHNGRCMVRLEAELVYEAGYRKQSEWISVSERLPESGAHCLLCCELRCIDGTRRPYVCDGFHVERFNIKASGVDDECVTEYNEEDDEYYISEGWYEVIKNWGEYSCIVIDDFVTHWMPLPEPPKGE